MTAKFPIPSSFPDLERPPYNLLPYPPNAGFEHDNEAMRADSFDALLDALMDGNEALQRYRMRLFEDNDTSNMNTMTMTEGGNKEWCDEERLQALYTLVR